MGLRASKKPLSRRCSVAAVPGRVSTTASTVGAASTSRPGIDERGAVATAAFRRHRLPQYADIPRTEVHFEVHFMETADTIGPLGAKSMSVSPFTPVAPAFATALRDATGVRLTELAPTRDRVWLALHEAGVPDQPKAGVPVRPKASGSAQPRVSSSS